MLTASFPALARRAAIEDDADALRAHLRRSGVRFNASQKAEDAAVFSEREGGSSLAFPTKLHGVTAFQTAAAHLAAGQFGRTKYRRLVARIVPDDRKGREGLDRIALHVHGCRLGFLADKHLPWLLPLLTTDERGAVAFCGVEFFALAVTGGTQERPTRGANVCITGLAARVRTVYRLAPAAPEEAGSAASADHYAAEMEAEALLAAQEDAYASGSRTRIHAMTDAEHEASEHANGTQAGASALAAARLRLPNAHELDFLGDDDEPLVVLYDGGRECDPDGRNPAWVLDTVEVFDATGRDVTERYAEAAEAAIWEAAREAHAEAY